MSTQGERVKEIRQSLKLSQTEFGDILGIGKQFVSKIENNSTLLNNEKLVTLLVNYNVNINYILAGIGEMFNKLPETNALQNTQDKKELAKLIKETVTDMILEKGGQELYEKIFKQT